MRKSHLTCCKSGSEDGTLLHLALSHFVWHPHSHPFADPNRHASWTTRRNAEVIANWGEVVRRQTEGRVCEAGYEGMIGRTLGNLDQIYKRSVVRH